MNKCGSCKHFLEEECTNKLVPQSVFADLFCPDERFVEAQFFGCTLHEPSPIVAKFLENIVEWCRINEQYVRNQFEPPLTDEQFGFTLDEKNWIPFERVFRGGNLHMGFDNEELDSQLRAYTIADRRANKVRTHVQGE